MIARLRIYASRHAMEHTRLRTANMIAKSKQLIALTRKLLARKK